MNAPSLTIPSLVKPSDSGVVVAAHFDIPTFPLPALDMMIWQNTAKAFEQWGAALGFVLRQAGLIESSGGIAFHGTARNGLVMFRTERRNEAIKLLREFISGTWGEILDLGAPFTPVEIAYKTADGVWFTCEPKAHPEPFERWFESSCEWERDDRSLNAAIWMQQLVQAIARACPPDPLPPS